MIKSIRLRNFKNFEDTTVHLGPFSVLAGENVTGKSNVGDALRIFHEFFVVDLDSMFQQMGQPVRDGAESASIEIEVPGPDGEDLRYRIAFAASGATPQSFQIVKEELLAARKAGMPLETVPLKQASDNTAPEAPALIRTMYADGFGAWSKPVLHLLGALTCQRLVPVPENLRRPGWKKATKVGESGQDFPTVLERLCRDPDKKATIIEWLRELTPNDICDMDFVPDPNGDVHLQVKQQDGATFGARSVSDGTLRFMAVLTALLGASENTTLFLDELEAGLHPSRIQLLIRLIEKQTAETGVQVIATTHSPEVLDRIGERAFEDSTALARIRGHEAVSAHRMAELPQARALRETRGMGALLRDGWMENVLYLEDDDQKTEAAHPEPAIS